MRRILMPVVFQIFLLCNSYAQGKDSMVFRPAQNDSISRAVGSGPHMRWHPDYKKRRIIILGATAAAFSGSFVVLNTVWYSQYERTRFHTFDDAAEWMQVDKLGHAWSTYNMNGLSTAAWRWAGLPAHKAVLAGSITSLAYVSIIELLDGYSAKWGWSWADMGANVFGTSLFAAQQLQWKEQRIRYKFSVHFKNYPPDLEQRSDELFGHTVTEKLFKDYNAQTYWLSANMRSFFPGSPLPAWLNISVGYGAGGMFGGFDNIGFDHDGNRTFYRPDVRRYRQWFLSPDVDLTKIKTRSKALRTVFTLFNNIKFPAPALEFSQGKLKGKLLYF